jgi:hypothetical protein
MALLLSLPQRPRPMSDQAKAQYERCWHRFVFQVGAPRMAALGPRSIIQRLRGRLNSLARRIARDARRIGLESKNPKPSAVAREGEEDWGR